MAGSDRHNTSKDIPPHQPHANSGVKGYDKPDHRASNCCGCKTAGGGGGDHGVSQIG